MAIAAVVAGLVGNAVMNPPYLRVFLEYFVPTVLVVSIMLGRIAILKACLFIVRASIASLIGPLREPDRRPFATRSTTINAQQVVFFTRGDNTGQPQQRDALRPAQRTHQPRQDRHGGQRPEEKSPSDWKHDLKFLDEAYPEIDIEFVVIERRVRSGVDPGTVEEVEASPRTSCSSARRATTSCTAWPTWAACG